MPETMDEKINRRSFLKYVVGGSITVAVGAAAYYYLGIRPEPPVTPVTSTTTVISPPVSTTSTSPATSLQSLSDYLKSNGVSDVVADMASSYGTLDDNKKKLGDFIIVIGEVEPSYLAVDYQANMLQALQKEDPNDVSAGRLETLGYLFSDHSLAINMLQFCMYPGVFDYLDVANSKYGDVDKTIVYATLGIPRFRQVDKNKDLFESVMQRGTSSQQFKSAFGRMLSEGNVDKSKYRSSNRYRYSGFCTPLESFVWELLDDDKKADTFLGNYDMKTLVSDAFRNTTSSRNYRRKNGRRSILPPTGSASILG
jgi:hypothetical protein